MEDVRVDLRREFYPGLHILLSCILRGLSPSVGLTAGVTIILANIYPKHTTAGKQIVV